MSYFLVAILAACSSHHLNQLDNLIFEWLVANFSELFFCFYQLYSSSSYFLSVKLLNRALIIIIVSDELEWNFFLRTFKFHRLYPESSVLAGKSIILLLASYNRYFWGFEFKFFQGTSTICCCFAELKYCSIFSCIIFIVRHKKIWQHNFPVPLRTKKTMDRNYFF